MVKHWEWRVRGSSILIIYEGDEGRVREVLGSTAEEGAGERREIMERVARVRLIDFAHARFAESTGPDEGYCLGFRTAISLLEGRLRELRT